MLLHNDDNYIGGNHIENGNPKERLVILKENKIFPCYSIPMRDFFTKHGIRYELVGLHPETHKMFWIYIKTKKLIEAM